MNSVFFRLSSQYPGFRGVVGVWVMCVLVVGVLWGQEVKRPEIMAPTKPKVLVVASAGDLTVRVVQCPKKQVHAGEELRAGFQVVAGSTFSNPLHHIAVDIVLAPVATYPMPAPLAVYAPHYAPNVMVLGGREFITFPGPGNVNVKLNGNNTIPGDTPPGNYFLGVVVDAGNSVAEINERNNVYFCPIEVVASGGGQQPDIIVSSVVFSKVQQKQDVTGNSYWIFNVIITVKNSGSGAAGPFKVLLERNVGAGGAYTQACATCLLEVAGLAAGQSLELPPRQFNNANQMNALFRATADVGNTVAETNEGNNMCAENFTAH